MSDVVHFDDFTDLWRCPKASPSDPRHRWPRLDLTDCTLPRSLHPRAHPKKIIFKKRGLSKPIVIYFPNRFHTKTIYLYTIKRKTLQKC